MEDLMKHPYHSSKYLLIIVVERAGTGIFLMKERAKVYKAQSSRVSHPLSKRLQAEEEKQGEPPGNGPPAEKRKKLADGSAQIVDSSQNQHS